MMFKMTMKIYSHRRATDDEEYETVHDVLGIPIGGKKISKAKADSGKFAYLRSMGMSRLPSAKLCGENLLKDDISDGDLVRNFLTVALVTFLCPHSCVYPSTEYLKPLVDIKRANGWDWSKFVHYWLFKQIKNFNRERKKKDQASITMGGCFYIIGVVYLDFLKSGQQQLPPTLPRISVWKGDMIRERSKFDCVQGHTYGKCQVLPFKSTCYYKENGGRTPSPTYVIDSATFKKTLSETFHGSMSPETLNGVTELYKKHSAGNTDSAPETAQNIIMDVIDYFYKRAQRDKRASSSNGDGTPNVPMDTSCDKDKNVPREEEQSADDAHAHVDGNEGASAVRYECSGNTVVITPSSGDCTSTPESITETVKVSGSFYCTADLLNSSQGDGSQAKRRLSTCSVSANNESGVSTVAERTRSRRTSFSPHSAADQPGFVDNPEAILTKNNAKRLASRPRTQPDKVFEGTSLMDDNDVIFCGYFPSQQPSSTLLASLPGDGHPDHNKERLAALKKSLNHRLGK